MNSIREKLEAIKSIVSSLDNLAAEKKKIDAQMAELRLQEDAIRADMLKEMIDGNEKEIAFDGFAEVAVRRSPKQYLIKDETAFAELAKLSGRYEEIFKTEVKLSKTAMNKFLSELNSCGSIPSYVEIQSGDEGVSITWAKAKPIASALPKVASKISPANSSELLQDLDTL
jgi:seryl-tRNA synthetase